MSPMINPNQTLTAGVFEELLTKALIASEERVEKRVTKKILDHVDVRIGTLRAEMLERFDDVDYTLHTVFQHLAYLAETIDTHYSEFTQVKKLVH